METRIEDGHLIIKIQIQPTKRSASGKMSLVASSGGWQDLGVEVDGKPLRGNFTAGYYNKVQG